MGNAIRCTLTSRRKFVSIFDDNAGDASRRCATPQTAKGRASVLFLFPAVLSASASQRYLTDATMESINSTPPSMSSLPSNRDTSMCPSSNTSISTRCPTTVTEGDRIARAFLRLSRQRGAQRARPRRGQGRPDDGRSAALARRGGSRAPHRGVRHLPAHGRLVSGALRAHGVRDRAAALLHHDGREVHVSTRSGRGPLSGLRAVVVARFAARASTVVLEGDRRGAALFRPGYTPHAGGSTEQALEYLARSPAAQAAAYGGNWQAPTRG